MKHNKIQYNIIKKNQKWEIPLADNHRGMPKFIIHHAKKKKKWRRPKKFFFLLIFLYPW